MSKLSPMAQSVAGILAPEADRVRAKAGSAPTAHRVPGGGQALSSGKSQDSLGNPNSPGYDGGGPRKKKPNGAPIDEKKEHAAKGREAPTNKAIETQEEGPHTIRLSVGWEKLLVAQKKICEKAKGLFTKLEGPVKYTGQKRNKLIFLKSRGSILDLQMEDSTAADKDKAKDEDKKSA